MVEFLNLAKQRYSVRDYEKREVEEEKLQRILEAGRIAPTGANRQPQRFIVVRSEEGLSKLKGSANVYGAPLAIIVCADHSATWKRSYDRKDIADIDASIVTDHMMLEATELGLGSVWICHFNPEKLRINFDIPENIEPVNILVLGYAAGEAASPDRHDTLRVPIDQLVLGEY